MQLNENNIEKHNSYKILNGRLNKAMSNGFYLEACFIEYAILEDRLASILHHCKVCKNAYDKKISNKINSLKQEIGKKHPVISKKVNASLLDEILIWKNKRNEYVHRACLYKMVNDEIEQLAIEGKELVRRITNDSQKVTRLANKLYGEE